MTFATLRRADGFGLGLRTDRGILDVVAAEQDFREGAPTTITAVFNGQGDIAGLQPSRRQGQASANAARYFIAEDKAQFGPCVTDPEKIVCVGLNYRKHAAETGNPVPEVADPVQQVQHRAQPPRRQRSRVSKDDAEQVRLRGRAGDRDRPRPRATSARPTRPATSSATAPATTSPRATCSRAASQWMLGKTLDGSGADRAVAGHRRPGRRRQPQDRVPRQRRGAPVLEHLRHGVQLQAAGQLHLATTSRSSRATSSSPARPRA